MDKRLSIYWYKNIVSSKRKRSERKRRQKKKFFVKLFVKVFLGVSNFFSMFSELSHTNYATKKLRNVWWMADGMVDAYTVDISILPTNGISVSVKI